MKTTIKHSIWHGESLEVVDNTHIQRLIREARYLLRRVRPKVGCLGQPCVDFNVKRRLFMVDAK